MHKKVCTTSNVQMESITLRSCDDNDKGPEVLGFFVPTIILIEIFSKLLSLNDICQFDSAMYNKKRRLLFIKMLQSECCVFPGDKDRDISPFGIFWLKNRRISIQRLRCSRITDGVANIIGSFGSHLGVFSHLLSFSVRDDNLNNGRKRNLINDVGIIAIAKGCPNLQTLSLHGCNDLTDLSIIEICRYCLKLEGLDLSRCHNLSLLLEIMPFHLPLLKNLDLSRCDGLESFEPIIALLQRCTDFQSLNLMFLNVTDADLIRIAECCPNLRDLNLGQTGELTDLSMSRLAQTCPELRSLDVSFCQEISDRSITRLLDKCPYLTSLDLSSCDEICYYWLMCDEKCYPNFESLTFKNGVNVTDWTIIKLAHKCVNLSYLDLSDCTEVSDKSIVVLARNCPKIRSLNLSYTDGSDNSKITDVSMLALSEGCNNLRTLNISWCWKITTKGIAALGKGCPYLEDLRMIQLESFDDEGMSMCINIYMSMFI